LEKSVFSPPARHKNTVSGAAKGSLILGKKGIKDNHLSENAIKKDAFILTKPENW